ncbi:hypothetical protein JCM30760_19180 [Thiomicrorhabdus hydrogeniphila]
MSVLLDALKKAAEEKKAANSSSGSIDALDSVAAVQETTLDEQETSSAHQDAEPEDISIPEETESQETELPLFDLKINEPVNEESETSALDDNSLLDSQTETNAFTLKLASEEIKDDENHELVSLMDSLDEKDSTSEVQNLGLDGSNVNPINEVDSQYNDVNEEKLSSSEKPVSNDEDFAWSLDKLPGYTADDPKNVVPNDTAYVTNPILVSGENTPPKQPNKYTTSTRVILSLVVVLLFIGIGFYGLLYYQEQNEELEFSMRKYNLTKMALPNKTDNKPNQQLAENSTTDDTFNLVSSKVDSLGNSVKESVDKNATTSVNNDEDLIASQNTDTVKPVNSNGDNKVGQSNLNKATKVNSSHDAVNKIKTTKKINTYHSTKKTSKTVFNNSRNNANLDPYKGVIVTSSTKSDIAKAYSAYSSGDYIEAKSLFTKILQKDPKNINAMLGMGGASVAEEEYRQAISFYQRVLDTEPNNIHAYEAIANLSGRVQLNKTWSNELENMVRKFPRSAVLQYAQGNIYAKQNDWLKAQENYFNALVADPENPDYMVNLAISFDHLGKYKLADKYYTQALGFAGNKKVSFNQTQVKNRLISIRQFIVKGH